MKLNQKERLAICSSCINRRLDFEKGFVCGLTGRFAEFHQNCKDYHRDDTATDTIRVRTEERPVVPLFDPVPVREDQKKKSRAAARKQPPSTARKKPSSTARKQPTSTARKPPSSTARKQPTSIARKKLRKYQSFFLALTGGLLVAVLVALGWAYISLSLGYNEPYMALGAGLLIGLAVRYFGAGLRWFFGVLAAILTLAGSLLGFYLGHTGLLEEILATGSIPLSGYFIPELMLDILGDGFVPLDLLFPGLAAILAYLLAVRRVGKKKMARLEEEENHMGAPALHRFRIPFILIGILLPAIYVYTLQGEDSEEFETIFYEPGKKASEGIMRNGMESGLWTAWHENGNLKYKGYYSEGEKDSLWNWYDEAGILTRTGMYSRGVESGIWMDYFPDGLVSDSGAYSDGMKEGMWKHFHENGQLKLSENYKAGKMHGDRILMSNSGIVVKVERYENGLEVETE